MACVARKKTNPSATATMVDVGSHQEREVLPDEVERDAGEFRAGGFGGFLRRPRK